MSLSEQILLSSLSANIQILKFKLSNFKLTSVFPTISHDELHIFTFFLGKLNFHVRTVEIFRKEERGNRKDIQGRQLFKSCKNE
jgi:hypothetical protein